MKTKKLRVAHASTLSGYNYTTCKLKSKFVLQVILHNLGTSHSFYKDYAQAAITFKKLLDFEPNDVSAVETYGRVLAMSGRITEAKEQYERALKLAQDKQNTELIEKVTTLLVSERKC